MQADVISSTSVVGRTHNTAHNLALSGEKCPAEYFRFIHTNEKTHVFVPRDRKITTPL